jgi:hypothetical protein
MDADLNLNHSANLPDGTAKANRPHPDVSAADLARGFTTVEAERIRFFDPDTTGEKQVGDPFTYGGFLGRPQGTAR